MNEIYVDALATLSAISGAAFAQSSVTLYGVLDMGYQSNSATFADTKVKQTAIANGVQSGGRIGFKGTEDLGGGMKANFVVENGITPDEATTAFGTSNRQSFVSVDGGFGTVAIGRQYTVHHNNQGAGDMVGNITMVGYLGGVDSLVRASNAITYTTPSFNGFTVSAEYALGETVQVNGAPNKASTTGVRVAYAAGPFAAGIAHEETKNGTFADLALNGRNAETGVASAATDVTAFDKRKADSVSASYDLGVAKFGLVSNRTTADDLKWTANTISVSVPMGAAALVASTGSGKLSNAGETVTKASAYQLGATYALSKRTNLYAFTGKTKFKDLEARATQTTVGIRHQF